MKIAERLSRRAAFVLTLSVIWIVCGLVAIYFDKADVLDYALLSTLIIGFGYLFTHEFK